MMTNSPTSYVQLRNTEQGNQNGYGGQSPGYKVDLGFNGQDALGYNVYSNGITGHNLGSNAISQLNFATANPGLIYGNTVGTGLVNTALTNANSALINNAVLNNALIGNGVVNSGLVNNALVNSNALIGNGVVNSGLVNNALVNSNALIGNGVVNSGLVNNALVNSNALIGNGLVNSGLVNNGLISNGIVGTGLINPGLVNSVAGVTGTIINPLLATNGILPGQNIFNGIANPLLTQSGGIFNPLLGIGLGRPDIWQLGLPQQGLNHHILLQPNHGHHGLLHPAAHHGDFVGLGYGYPFGGGIPPFGDNGHATYQHHHPAPHGFEDNSEPHHNNHHFEHSEETHHSEPHAHQPLHLPVHPDDIDFIEMNEDAPYQIPSCSRDSEKDWCTEDERYPKKQIELAGHIHADGLMHLYADISDLDSELSVKGAKFIYDESYLCPSETNYIRPLRAINTHGKWRVIVNDVKIHYQKLTQSSRIEECASHGKPCPLIPHCYDTKCLQKLVYHRFLVFDPYDHGFPFAIENFRLPSSCACKIDEYKLPKYR